VYPRSVARSAQAAQLCPFMYMPWMNMSCVAASVMAGSFNWCGSATGEPAEVLGHPQNRIPRPSRAPTTLHPGHRGTPETPEPVDWPAVVTDETDPPAVPVLVRVTAHGGLTEPTLTEPTLTEPTLAEPTLAEPTLAEPTLAEPTLAEPTLAEPTLAEPTLAEPTLTEPTLTASRGSTTTGWPSEWPPDCRRRRSATPAVEQI